MSVAATDQVYLFSVNPSTPPTMTIDPGEEVSVEVRGAFADVADIRDIPTPFTPACDGHPLAPISGPVAIRGAEPGDAVTVSDGIVTGTGVECTSTVRARILLHKAQKVDHPIMAARLIVPRETLMRAGWNGELWSS